MYINPDVGVSCQLNYINTIQSTTTIPTNTTIEIKSESETTSIALPPFTKLHMNHGSGSPSVTSKIFDPILDDTAELADPFLTFTMDVSMSGTLVPAASMVRPITVSGM